MVRKSKRARDNMTRQVKARTAYYQINISKRYLGIKLTKYYIKLNLPGAKWTLKKQLKSLKKLRTQYKAHLKLRARRIKNGEINSR